MGRVKNKTVKRAARNLIEKYYAKLSTDFHFNKKILDDVAHVSTKKLRNKIAGFTSHLMKRIQTGPVRGISLKVQEEERERRLDFIPKVSNVDVTKIVEVEKDVMEMLSSIGMESLKNQHKLVAVRSKNRVNKK